jgi:hypothetical protein
MHDGSELGERWALDFISNSTTDGHRFGIDTFTRRAPGLVAVRSIDGRRLVRFLDCG